MSLINIYFVKKALDPFDALLKDRSDPVPETSTASVSVAANADDDDDEHHADADPVEADTHEDEDHHAGQSIIISTIDFNKF